MGVTSWERKLQFHWKVESLRGSLSYLVWELHCNVKLSILSSSIFTLIYIMYIICNPILKVCFKYQNLKWYGNNTLSGLITPPINFTAGSGSGECNALWKICNTDKIISNISCYLRTAMAAMLPRRPAVPTRGTPTLSSQNSAVARLAASLPQTAEQSLAFMLLWKLGSLLYGLPQRYVLCFMAVSHLLRCYIKALLKAWRTNKPVTTLI